MPVGLAGVPQRKDDLDFIVVGGGITGIVTAWSLQEVGHRVTLFEQQSADVMAKCREGIRSTPSMIQILSDWGLRDRISNISTLLTQTTFLDGKTGEELGLIAFDGRVTESVLANMCGIQYGELFSIFYDLLKDTDVDLHFNTKIVAVDPWRGTVTCEDGRQWSADVIVGADGAESTVRPMVLEASPLCNRDNRFTVNLVAPVDVVRQDEELAAILDSKSWTVWLADDCSMHGILAGSGPNRDYSILMNITIQSQDVLEEFPMSLESLRVDLFESRAQKLLSLSEQLSKSVFTHYEPFDNWVHESGKVVLMGQAAHPILPAGSQALCTCIEDVMTISALFSLPVTKSQTPMLLNVYEELRQPRCATIQRYVLRKRDVATMALGAGQRRRDALLRDQRACHQCDELDDEFLYNTYSGVVQVYGFDAREAVQDWWVKWGKIVSMRSPSTEGDGENEDEYDDSTLLPVVVDAEVERDGPTYPVISDPIIGEDDIVGRECAEAHRRHSISSIPSLPFLRLDSSS